MKIAYLQGYPMRKVSTSWKRLARFAAGLKLNGVDVVVFNKPYKLKGKYDLYHINKPLLNAISGYIQSQKNRALFVLDIDDLDSEFYQWLKIPEKFFLRHADGITVASNELHKLSPESTYIPNGTYTDNIQPASTEKDDIYAFCNPLLSKWDDADMLVYAMQVVKKEIADAKLIIAGGGVQLQNLKELSNKLNLNDNIVWMGQVPYEYNLQLLRNASIGILPYRNTLLNRCRCPGKMFEYMAAGLAIVGTNVGEMKHILEHNKDALLVNDDIEMGEALINLFENEQLRIKLGRNAREKCVEKYDYRILSKQMMKFYERIIEEEK